MEDLQIRYDGTVRNALGEVVQFLYGEDGLDPVRIEKQKIAQAGMKFETFQHHAEWQIDNPSWRERQRDVEPANLLAILHDQVRKKERKKERKKKRERKRGLG